MTLSNFHRISVFLWMGENDWNTRIFSKKEEKKISGFKNIGIRVEMALMKATIFFCNFIFVFEFTRNVLDSTDLVNLRLWFLANARKEGKFINRVMRSNHVIGLHFEVCNICCQIFLDMGVKILKWMINIFKRCFGYFYLFCIVIHRERDIYFKAIIGTKSHMDIGGFVWACNFAGKQWWRLKMLAVFSGFLWWASTYNKTIKCLFKWKLFRIFLVANLNVVV